MSRTVQQCSLVIRQRAASSCANNAASGSVIEQIYLTTSVLNREIPPTHIIDGKP